MIKERDSKKRIERTEIQETILRNKMRALKEPEVSIDQTEGDQPIPKSNAIGSSLSAGVKRVLSLVTMDCLKFGKVKGCEARMYVNEKFVLK